MLNGNTIAALHLLATCNTVGAGRLDILVSDSFADSDSKHTLCKKYKCVGHCVAADGGGDGADGEPPLLHLSNVRRAACRSPQHKEGAARLARFKQEEKGT